MNKTTDELLDLVRRLAVVLDVALPHLTAQADRERLRQEGKALREVTAQRRAEAAQAAVREASDLLGLGL